MLHFGPIPDFDESSWDLEVSGLVDNPYRLTYRELKDLGPADVEADMHCVTGWSTLDNTWTGVPFRVLAEKAGVQPRRLHVGFSKRSGKPSYGLAQPHRAGG